MIVNSITVGGSQVRTHYIKPHTKPLIRQVTGKQTQVHSTITRDEWVQHLKNEAV